MVEQFKQIMESEDLVTPHMRKGMLSLLMGMLEVVADKAPRSEAAKLQVRNMRDFEQEFSRSCLKTLLSHMELYEFDTSHEYYTWDTINGHGKLISLSHYDYEEILLANMDIIIRDYTSLGGE